MTGAPGVVEAVLAVIGLIWVLIIALGLSIVITLHALRVPVPDPARIAALKRASGIRDLDQLDEQLADIPVDQIVGSYLTDPTATTPREDPSDRT